MFENRGYRWRETYFVFFHSSDRPSLKSVQKALGLLNERYNLANPSTDEGGLIDSLTVISPDDFAALDICYTQGPEVLEQGADLADQLRSSAAEPPVREAAKRIRQCDARFDVLHFEEVAEFPEDEDDEDEILDPSSLLLVLGVLAKFTNGIAVDPQSGALLCDDE